MAARAASVRGLLAGQTSERASSRQLRVALSAAIWRFSATVTSSKSSSDCHDRTSPARLRWPAARPDRLCEPRLILAPAGPPRPAPASRAGRATGQALRAEVDLGPGRPGEAGYGVDQGRLAGPV